MYFRNSRPRAWPQSGTVNAYAGVRLYGVVNQWPQYCRQNVRVQNEGVCRPTRVSISSRDVISSPVHSTVRMPRTNLFNIDRLAFVRNAPVNHQCSGDLRPGRETGEGHTVSRRKLCDRVVGHFAATLHAGPGASRRSSEILLFQYMRTEAASRRAVEMQGGRHGW